MTARRDDDNINRLTRAAAVVLHRKVRVADDEMECRRCTGADVWYWCCLQYRKVSFHRMRNTVTTSKTVPTTVR
jgi:hypothetical protein